MGVLYGLISSATFGLISFFTIPLLMAGSNVETALVYRFVIAAVAMWLILLARRERILIGWSAFLKIAGLAVFYMLAVLLFFQAIQMLPSGLVATLQYLYPVMVMLILAVFFQERFRWQTMLALLLAVGGVALLSLGPVGPPVQGAAAGAGRAALGIAIALISGLCNALYYVGLQVARLPRIDGFVLTFYVMLVGAVFCVANGLVMGGLQWLSTASGIANAVALALVTAVVSNLTLILAVRRIGSTLASILGVMEPLTAVVVGVLAFREPFSAMQAWGSALVLLAVLIALLAPRAARQE